MASSPRSDTAMPTPQQIAVVAAYAERLAALGHGDKAALLDEACAALGCTRQTFYRWASPHLASERKQRSDAGQSALSRDELEKISAMLMEGWRQNGNQILAVKRAVEALRANGVIRAKRMDSATGEVIELNPTTIIRALRDANLHPEQLRRPTPHTPLMSPWPNHTWQVDASVCVVFYLPLGKDAGGTAIVPLSEAVHYKNKPENLKAIERFRVIRYVGVDHHSGAGRWRYYPHSESGAHTVAFLAWMMAPKANPADPMNGAPWHLMVDPGATAANLVARWCQRMTINLIVNKPGNPRAKGSVEKLNHLVETVFESGLRYQRHRVSDIEQLNALAEKVQLHWNATAVHTRHKKTRFAKWMEIPADRLRITRDAATLLTLATTDAKRPVVNGDLTVNYAGRVFKVDHVPQAVVKGRLDVCQNPYHDGAMAVVMVEGQETHIPLPERTLDAHGFASDAVEIGAAYQAPKDTVLETNRKRVAEVAAGTEGLAATEAARRSKDYVPLRHLVPGGVDPFKTAKEAPPVVWMPKRGTPLEVSVPAVEATRISATQACMRIQEALKEAWRPDHYQWVMRRFKEGATDQDIKALIRQFQEGGDQQEAQAC